MGIGDFKHRNATGPKVPISALAPYAGLILTVTLCILFIVKNYVLDPLLPRLYGPAQRNLTVINQRSFLNQHVAVGMRLVLLALGGYPFLAIVFGRSVLNSPVTRGGKITMGDCLITSSQLLVAMYIFELIYRVKISIVSALHHLGTVLVAEAAVAISIYGHKDAHYEFILCCIWGAFDVIVEILPSLAIIRYRMVPQRHHHLHLLFVTTAIWTFAGTVLQGIVAMYLFGSLWDKWELSFKIATPILHVAFSAAQLHGTNIFRKMARRERKRLQANMDLMSHDTKQDEFCNTSSEGSLSNAA